MFMLCFAIWAFLVAWLIVTIWLEQDRLVGLPLFAGGMLFLGMFIISNFNLEAANFVSPLVVIFAIIEIIVDISCRWEIMEQFVKKILWIYGFALAIKLIHERKKEGTRII